MSLSSPLKSQSWKSLWQRVAGEIAKNDAKWQYCKLLKDKSHIHKGQRVCSILRTVVTGEQLEHTNSNIVGEFSPERPGATHQATTMEQNTLKWMGFSLCQGSRNTLKIFSFFMLCIVQQLLSFGLLACIEMFSTALRICDDNGILRLEVVAWW